MAISINDRQLITQFITNTQNLNVNLPTNGGGCANLVRGIIEQATGKRISVNPFGVTILFSATTILSAVFQPIK